MHQLFVIIPAAVFLIAVAIFVLSRVLRRTVVSPQEEKSELGVTQRREFFRVEVPEPDSFIVTLELDAGTLTGCRLLNISVGGMAVLAVRHPIVLEIGSKIKEIKVVFPSGEEARSSALVKYVLRESDSDWNRYGVQFVGLSDAQSRIITKYVIQAEAKKIKEHRTIPTEEEKADL